MQAIEPDSLRFSWQAICADAKIAPPQLDLEMLPWELDCPRCNRHWQSDQMYVQCACGCATPSVVGGAELQMLSIQVEDAKGL